MDRAFMRESDWELSITLAATDPFVARWLTLAKRHAPLVAQSDSFVVTQRAIEAFFLSSDCVGRPGRTASEHERVPRGLRAVAAHRVPSPPARRARACGARRAPVAGHAVLVWLHGLARDGARGDQAEGPFAGRCPARGADARERRHAIHQYHEWGVCRIKADDRAGH
jgi:hypothetical protein